jgi:voltage-gated potassium channel Kch
VAKSWFQSRSGPAIILGVTLAAVCWFRCNEILVAFVADVVEQLSEKTETRVFHPLERLRMLIESYLEVILYFAIIYALLPETWFLDSKLSNAGDALYFSAITITTVGYGDIVPLHTVARILAVQEALVGLSLIVLVIGVYISAAQGPTA